MYTFFVKLLVLFYAIGKEKAKGWVIELRVNGKAGRVEGKLFHKLNSGTWDTSDCVPANIRGAAARVWNLTEIPLKCLQENSGLLVYTACIL